MHNGYLSLGGSDFATNQFELVNTGRVQAYIQNWNRRVRQGSENGECIDWYQNCDECDSADAIFTNGRGYVLPQVDPAPWYDPNVRDSAKFFGVVGLEITGAEDSTRTATVRTSLTGGGAISRLRYGPRTLVVRGLAVAADACGLEVGLNWMRCQYETTTVDCGQDFLWFLDCCPDCVSDPNSPPVGPCWPDTYAQLKSPWTIDCGGAWTPPTYGDLRNGPQEYITSGWCAWAQIYYELRVGLPEFACDLRGCLLPYIRNFQSVRVVEGPTVLRRQSLSNGEIAEVEFTVACGDPHEYSPTITVHAYQGLPAPVSFVDDLPPAPAPPAPDPFATGVSAPLSRRSIPDDFEMPTEWLRSTINVTIPPKAAHPTVVPSILVSSDQGESGPVRVGIRDKTGKLVAGFTLPFVPRDGVVLVDTMKRDVLAEAPGRMLSSARSFLRSYEGTRLAEFPEMAPGSYVVEFDQAANKAAPLSVEFRAATKGCA
jgi:hypothetical protein